MKFRTADGVEHEGVPVTPGLLLKETLASSDGSVWIVEPGGWRRLLRWEEFLSLFPAPHDNIHAANQKREKFIIHDDLATIKLLPNSPQHPHGPLGAPPAAVAADNPDPVALILAIYSAQGTAPPSLELLRGMAGHDLYAMLRNLQDQRPPGFGLQNPFVKPGVLSPPYPAAPTPTPSPSADSSALRGAVFVASPELREWSTRHDATGRSHIREWFDEKCRNGAGPHFELGVDLENDGLLFDRMNTLIDECKARGKRAHIWAQGDTEHFQGGIPRADWDRVWRRMDALVEAIKPHAPAISLGLGFDLWEWVPGSRHRDFTEFHRWVNAMRSEIPGLLIGGRPQARNSRNHPDEPWPVISDWNRPCTYYSVEFGKPTPGELDELAGQAAAQHKVAFSENRDRLFNEPYYSYAPRELAAVIREYRKRGIACVVANWEFKKERGRRTGPLPHFVYEAMDEPVPAPAA